ncbi:hypothetical protein F4777DRAFT_560335 [Nemania sp. FL0916]|nr:hypothetical protein F4777DRAFT_560335 [Nemania sp. FL0916]
MARFWPCGERVGWVDTMDAGWTLFLSSLIVMRLPRVALRAWLLDGAHSWREGVRQSMHRVLRGAGHCGFRRAGLSAPHLDASYTLGFVGSSLLVSLVLCVDKLGARRHVQVMIIMYRVKH